MSEPAATPSADTQPSTLTPPPAVTPETADTQTGSDPGDETAPVASEANLQAGQDAAAQFSETQAPLAGAPGEVNASYDRGHSDGVTVGKALAETPADTANSADMQSRGSRDPFVEFVAKLCHSANRAYCNLIGDGSQVAWEDAPEWQQQSSINGVKYQLENPTATPRLLHDNWSKEKVANGWVFGKEKNAEAKTHPCLVEYDQLSQEQKVKDFIFHSVVVGAMALRG